MASGVKKSPGYCWSWRASCRNMKYGRQRGADRQPEPNPTHQVMTEPLPGQTLGKATRVGRGPLEDAP